MSKSISVTESSNKRVITIRIEERLKEEQRLLHGVVRVTVLELDHLLWMGDNERKRLTNDPTYLQRYIDSVVGCKGKLVLEIGESTGSYVDQIISTTLTIGRQLSNRKLERVETTTYKLRRLNLAHEIETGIEEGWITRTGLESLLLNHLGQVDIGVKGRKALAEKEG